MSARPLTKEEKKKAKRIITRLARDSRLLYDLFTQANTSYEEAKMITDVLHEGIRKTRLCLEELRRIRATVDQFPADSELNELIEVMNKIRM